MKPKGGVAFNGVFILVTFLFFLLLFTYSSLNLKNIDYGYRRQTLIRQEKELLEQIDTLTSEKAKLLDLARVERLVMEKLGYRYPGPEQFIKVFDRSR